MAKSISYTGGKLQKSEAIKKRQPAFVDEKHRCAKLATDAQTGHGAGKDMFTKSE